MTIISSVAGVALSLTQRIGICSRLWSFNFRLCPPLSFCLCEIWKSTGHNSKQNSMLIPRTACHTRTESFRNTNIKTGWNSSCETALFPTFVVKFSGRPHLQTSTPKFRSMSTAANPWLKFDPKRTTWCSTVIQCCDKDQVNSCESSGMCNNTFANQTTHSHFHRIIGWALSVVDSSISPSQNPIPEDVNERTVFSYKSPNPCCLTTFWCLLVLCTREGHLRQQKRSPWSRAPPMDFFWRTNTFFTSNPFHLAVISTHL